MKFIKNTKPEFQEEHSNKCQANGCPLRGTMAPSDGRFVCTCHYNAEPEQWPRITEALRENERITLALNEVLRTGDIDWSMGKWQMMARFFDGEPELQPSVAERDHRRWYEYRLRGWMTYLTGVSGKRPVQREPLQPSKRRGNLSQFIGA